MRRIIFALLAVCTLSLAACSQQPAETADTEVQATIGATEAIISCSQEGCSEAAVNSDIRFCQNHIGICGLCMEYIDPEKEYCNQCTYDMGLPVDDPDFMPEGSKFTNRYGTPSTICAHKGCIYKIAYSGDTNCCTTHSQRCGNCDCYIDEDAVYCMECIENAIG